MLEIHHRVGSISVGEIPTGASSLTSEDGRDEKVLVTVVECARLGLVGESEEMPAPADICQDANVALTVLL